eukprot:771977-Prymnesium_polylepis.1
MVSNGCKSVLQHTVAIPEAQPFFKPSRSSDLGGSDGLGVARQPWANSSSKSSSGGRRLALARTRDMMEIARSASPVVTFP